jgi:hypothetical protein
VSTTQRIKITFSAGQDGNTTSERINRRQLLGCLLAVMVKSFTYRWHNYRSANATRAQKPTASLSEKDGTSNDDSRIKKNNPDPESYAVQGL